MYTPMWSSNPEVAFKALAPSHLKPPADWPDWKTGEINLVELPARERLVVRLIVRPLLNLLRRDRRLPEAASANVPPSGSDQVTPRVARSKAAGCAS